MLPKRKLCKINQVLFSKNNRGQIKRNHKFLTFLLTIITFISALSGFPTLMSATDTTQGDREINVNLTSFEPLLDQYGKPAINADGTFYPNDKFKIAYNTELASNIVFEKVEAIYNLSTFNMFNSNNFGTKVGSGSFEVKSSATAGIYNFYIKAWGSRFSDYGSESHGLIGVTYGGSESNAYYTTQYMLTITAASSEGTTNPAPGQYWHLEGTLTTITAIPSAGYLFNYWNLDGRNVSTSAAITVIMNSPHSLQAHFKQANSPQNTNVSDKSTLAIFPETKQFTPQATLEGQELENTFLLVTFTAHGLGTDAIGSALELDETTQVNARALPAKFDWNVGSTHTYHWLETIYSNNNGQRYILNKVTLKEKYLSTATLPIQVIEYDPHFTLSLAYTIPSSNGGSSYDKPFAMVIRYDGNGPDYNLEQRAVIEGYTWDGYAQKISALDNMQQMLTPNVTIASFLNQTSNVQFSAYGIDSKTGRPILDVDGTSFKASELPKAFYWETNSNHTYSWTQKLPVIEHGLIGIFPTEIESSYEWLEWQFGIAFPPSTNQMNLIQANQSVSQEDLQNQFTQQLNSPNGTLTITPFGNTITAVYAHNKLIEKFAKDAAVNQDQALKCLMFMPIFFDVQSRYAKIKFVLDSVVAQRISNQNFTDALCYNVTFGSAMFGKAKYFETNFTCQYEFYDKLINATAYKWDIALRNWSIDDTVNIQATFDTAFNFTQTDVLLSLFENQTNDQDALKLAIDDLYDSTAQTFTNIGTLEASLKRISPLYYNLEVVAGQNQNRFAVQRTVQLNFKNNETYKILLNFDSESPLQVDVVEDDTQNAKLLLNAPAQLGGVTSMSVYLITNAPSGYELDQIPTNQITRRLLNTFNLTLPQTHITVPPDYQQNYQLYQHYEGYSSIYDENLGFGGQTQIIIPKDHSTTALTGYDEVLLYVEAKNVWDTKFHTIIAIQPYAISQWEVFLDEVAVYLFITIAVAIVLSLAIYIIKGKST